MEAQRTLFDTPPPPIPPRDPNTAPIDLPRLSGQNAELLAMLRRGCVTNRCMIERGMAKYTSRISDLRKAGYHITAERLSGGIFVYRLER